MYKGRQYRSRLEARWAAFFDLVGWEAEYEPCDFNGWIPDFAIKGARGPLFVEVKPIEEPNDEVQREIACSGCESEVLIVGYTIGLQSSWGQPVIGWIGEIGAPEFATDEWSGHWWQDAIAGVWKGRDSGSNPSSMLGVAPSDGDYADRITGAYDGGRHGSVGGDVLERYVREQWAQAGNLTQWRRPVPHRPVTA